MVWKVEVNGALVDIRQETRERQEAAFKKRLIPYIPADRTTIKGGQASKPSPRLHSIEGNLFGTRLIREHVARLADRPPLMDDYPVDLEEIEDALAALVEARYHELGPRCSGMTVKWSPSG